MTSLDGNGHPDTVWTAADGQADLVASIIIQKSPTRQHGLGSSRSARLTSALAYESGWRCDGRNLSTFVHGINGRIRNENDGLRNTSGIYGVKPFLFLFLGWYLLTKARVPTSSRD